MIQMQSTKLDTFASVVVNVLLQKDAAEFGPGTARTTAGRFAFPVSVVSMSGELTPGKRTLHEAKTSDPLFESKTATRFRRADLNKKFGWEPATDPTAYIIDKMPARVM